MTTTKFKISENVFVFFIFFARLCSFHTRPPREASRFFRIFCCKSNRNGV